MGSKGAVEILFRWGWLAAQLLEPRCCCHAWDRSAAAAWDGGSGHVFTRRWLPHLPPTHPRGKGNDVAKQEAEYEEKFNNPFQARGDRPVGAASGPCITLCRCGRNRAALRWARQAASLHQRAQHPAAASHAPYSAIVCRRPRLGTSTTSSCPAGQVAAVVRLTVDSKRPLLHARWHMGVAAAVQPHTGALIDMLAPPPPCRRGSGCAWSWRRWHTSGHGGRSASTATSRCSRTDLQAATQRRRRTSRHLRLQL